MAWKVPQRRMQQLLQGMCEQQDAVETFLDAIVQQSARIVIKCRIRTALNSTDEHC